MEETKTTESIKIVQHTKYGLIDVIENKDCLEVRQLSQHGGRDIVLILPENRKSVALAICPELTQQQSVNAELKQEIERLNSFHKNLAGCAGNPGIELVSELKKQNDNLLKDCETSVNLRLKSEEENAKMFLEIEVMKKQNEELVEALKKIEGYLCQRKKGVSNAKHLNRIEIVTVETLAKHTT